MIRKIAGIHKSEGRGDEVGIIQNGRENLPETKRVPSGNWWKDVPVVDENGHVAVARTWESNGPEGMRHIGRVGSDLPTRMAAELINQVNGPGSCVLVPIEGQGHIMEMYATPEGTGTQHDRERLIAFVQGMRRLDRHDAELQAQIMPHLDEKTRSAYVVCPTGNTLWVAFVGQNPHDLQLPAQHIARNDSPEMQALRQKLFVMPVEPGKEHGLVIHNGQKIYRDSDGTIERIYSVTDPKAEGMASRSRDLYGEDVMWANRFCNFMNEMNGAQLFYLSSPDPSKKYERPNIFSDSSVSLSYQEFLFLENALVIANHYAPEKLAAMMPDTIARQAFLDNPCHNTAWIGLTGTDPRDYDEPVIGGRDEKNEPGDDPIDHNDVGDDAI